MALGKDEWISKELAVTREGVRDHVIAQDPGQDRGHWSACIRNTSFVLADPRIQSLQEHDVPILLHLAAETSLNNSQTTVKSGLICLHPCVPQIK